MIMDRPPLVQALTAAGLQRDGAEQGATALGEAIESSVATTGDIAALKADISRLDVAIGSVKGDIARSECAATAESAKIRAEMHDMEMRLTLRLGGGLVGSITLLFAALRFTGHTP